MTENLAPRREYLENPGILGLKAEFEAEGSTFEEMAKLVQFSNGLKLGLTVKIGGCEAVTDLRQALVLRPSQVVAPMVESRFAVKKFGAMMAKFDPEKSTRSLINVETRTAHQNLREILSECQESNVDGIVVGRGDLAESLGLERNKVDSSAVMEIVEEVVAGCFSLGLVSGIGGGVSERSLPGLRGLYERVKFNYFETRKVLLSPNGDLSAMTREALAFELSWLEQRAEESSRSVQLDLGRIERLAADLGRLVND